MIRTRSFTRLLRKDSRIRFRLRLPTSISARPNKNFPAQPRGKFYWPSRIFGAWLQTFVLFTAFPLHRIFENAIISILSEKGGLRRDSQVNKIKTVFSDFMVKDTCVIRAVLPSEYRVAIDAVKRRFGLPSFSSALSSVILVGSKMLLDDRIVNALEDAVGAIRDIETK